MADAGQAMRLLVLVAGLTTRAAQAHGVLAGSNSDGGGDQAWVVTAIVLAALGYGVGLRRVWRRSARGHREAAWRALAFGCGLGTLGVALLSALDRWGGQLFAFHMIQHELLMLVAAPLLVVGRPLPLFLWALGERPRARVAWIAHSSPVQTIWAGLLSPVIAWLLHALVLWVWHVPRFFDAVLRNGTLHDLQHLSFLAAALVFWAAMVETRRQEQQGAAVMCLFTTTIHTSVLGALITFAARPWYSAYLQTPFDWGLTALEDQQLGGLIMWVPGSLAYVGVALALLARWIRASDTAAAPR